MAEDKKSFLLYADLLKSIDHLTNEEKGVLFTHLLEYVNDKNPVLEDRLVLTAWKPIELQLKRDLNKYEKTKEEKSISGRIGNIKRYHLDIYKMFEAEEITLEKAEELAKSRKPSHSEKTVAKLAVNDTDTVNDTVIVNDIKNIDIPPTAFSMYRSLLDLGAEKQLINDWLKVRKTKKATNTKTALYGFISQVEKSNKDLNSILKICIENSWSGFKVSWLENLPKSESKIIPGETHEEKIRREYVERMTGKNKY